ncbi:hypothetical protein U9M48_009773 [Paspalum notatum var. saurae]|uniref:Uncharacterized protein n=1 Tax=Paspalum notatum var. saurae TaxID=547442 RepID=A0AAQ3SS26_PASNO
MAAVWKSVKASPKLSVAPSRQTFAGVVGDDVPMSPRTPRSPRAAVWKSVLASPRLSVVAPSRHQALAGDGDDAPRMPRSPGAAVWKSVRAIPKLSVVPSRQALAGGDGDDGAPRTPRSVCRSMKASPKSSVVAPSRDGDDGVPRTPRAVWKLVKASPRFAAVAPSRQALGGDGDDVPRTPRGYVPIVLVGGAGDEGGREERVMVRVEMLKEPRVATLLETAAQQFGYGQPGVLRVPCDADRFQQLLAGAFASVTLAGDGNDVPRTPKGYVPIVLVGGGDEGGREERVMVRVEMLKEPRVAALLETAAQQFGYGQPGVLRVPCDADRFQQLLAAACEAT